MFVTTKEKLVSHLIEDIGLTRTDIVFLQSGLIGLGLLDGGIETITSAFLEVLPEGLLVIPTFTYSWCSAEVFDPTTSECPNSVGNYAKDAWKDKRFVRTSNPNFSVALLRTGSNQSLIDSVMSIGNSCFGKNSVFDNIHRLSGERNGYIMLLGGAHSDCIFRTSYIHYVEENIGVPNRYIKKFYDPNCKDNFVEQICRFISEEEYTRVTGNSESPYTFPVVSDYTLLGKDLVDSKIINIKPFAYSETRVVPIRKFCDFLGGKLIENPDYCVMKDEKRQQGA